MSSFLVLLSSIFFSHVAAASCIAIAGGTVITSEGAVAGQTIVIDAGRISAIGSAAEVAVPANATRIDASGQFVAPGMVDAHVHLRDKSELGSYLRFGVTTVINLRGNPEIVSWREAVRHHHLPGPRILTAGPLIDGDPPIWSNGTLVLTDPGDVDALIDHHRARGYDLIKVYNNLSPAAMVALGTAARANGFMIFGHIPRKPERKHAFQRAADAGIDVVVHGEEFFFTVFNEYANDGELSVPTDADLARLANAVAQAEITVTPNLSYIRMTRLMLDDWQSVKQLPEYDRLSVDVQGMWERSNPNTRRELSRFNEREARKLPLVARLTRALHDQGATLVLGTDASAPGMFPGYSAIVEMEELSRAGFDPASVFAIATRNGGELVGRIRPSLSRLGRLEVGAPADLVILESDPLIDMSAYRSTVLAMVDGRIVFEK